MLMRVGEAGQDGAPFQVDHTRFRADEFLRIRIRADEDDPVFRDGDCLRARRFGIDGVDVTVLENDVGPRGLRRDRDQA